MAPAMVMSRAEVDERTLAEIAEACSMPVTQIEDVYACVPQQLEQIADRRSEVFQVVLSFSPKADIDRWCEAVRQVVSLNSVFRTRLVHCRLGIVQVVTSGEHVIENWSGDVEQYLSNKEATGLGLGTALFRSTVIDKTFVATIHHAIMDYWSLNSFFKEDVSLIYLGHPPKKRAAFKDFVALCINMDESAAESFWASRFKGVPIIFPIIDTDSSPCPNVEVTKKITLKRIGDRVSPSHLPWFAEAAWALTAAVYADSESIVYGTVLSGRSSALNGAETTLGPTVVEVPVQVNLQRNMTVEGLVKDRAVSLRQLTTQPLFLQFGIPRISAVSEAARTASRFQSLFNVVPPQPISLPATEEDLNSVRLDVVHKQARGGFSLMLLCRILEDEILLETLYDPAVLCEDQLHRVINQFEHTLRLLMEALPQAKLDKLQRLNSFDRSEILQWNNTMPEKVEKSIHEVFSAQARAQPHAVAVEASEGSMTYGELDRMSDALAHELQRRDVSPGKQVAFVFERSLWTIVAVLGIMKAGGTCVPVDRDVTHDRIAAIVSELNSGTILTSSLLYAQVIDLAPGVFAINKENIAMLPDVVCSPNNGTSSPEDSAYMFFTGRNTDAREGIALGHRCLVSSLTSLARQLGWQPGFRMLQFATHMSISSIYEIFGTLLFGGRLCIPSEEDHKSNLAKFMQVTKVNWALLTPSVLRDMSPSDLPDLESLLSFGEPIDAGTSKIWGEALRFYNGWGTRETSIVSTVAQLVPGSRYNDSIGTPIGCAVWIVNSQTTDELTPIGGVGELLIESQGVAKSHLKGETKTATCFITPPLWASSLARPWTRFCRTGDLGKYNPDGSISFVGRRENRVKLSGQTVQLEEIERIIASCSEVRDVVILTKVTAGRTQLVAVVCLADPRLPKKVVLQELSHAYADECLDRIRDFVKCKLPTDRVPSLLIAVERLPRTTSEKLDRVAVTKWLKTPRR